MPFSVRAAYLVLGCMICVGVFLLASEPIAQPLAYHHFADQRPMLGIPHMLNVTSNLPFLIVGVCGMIFMAGGHSRRPGVFLESAERWPYWIYFIGLALTAIGSAYYHAHPTNDRLTWDRLPLTVTFMALFTAAIAERLGWELSTWLLAPMIVLGGGSVVYWHLTELSGAGDLRYYLIVQFLPLIALPSLFVFFRPRYTGTADFVASLAFYSIAKILELLDEQVYTQSGFVSGHTLKHIMAGLAAFFILFMLQRRHPYTRSHVPTS